MDILEISLGFLMLIWIATAWKKGWISMHTRASVVNESRYLGNRRHARQRYAVSGQGDFLAPFSLSLEEMERIFLVDFEEDPIYSTLELQCFKDGRGSGAVILLYRKDHEIDVLYTPGLNREIYQGTPNGKIGIDNKIEYAFHSTQHGLSFNLNLTDPFGRKMICRIEENQPQKKFFDMLAPAGAMIDNLEGFPFFFMKQTAFVVQHGTQFEFTVDGKPRKPAIIPIAINGEHVYLSRYCMQPILGSWSKPYTGLCEKIQVSTSTIVKHGNKCYELSDYHGHQEISRIETALAGHSIYIAFSPSLPDLLCLTDNIKLKGVFSAGADQIGGVVAGKYQIKKQTGVINMVLQPTRGWQPMPGKCWVKTYRWQAEFELDAKGNIKSTTQWLRS